MQKSLNELREDLDAIDRELISLFEARMQKAGEIAAYKLAQGLPVLDAEREKQVIASRQAWLRNASLREPAAELLQTLMALSRAEQKRVMEEANRNA